MNAVDIVGLMVPVTYLIMLAVEARWPAREFPRLRGWRWVGLALLVFAGVVGTVLPLLLAPEWLAAHRLIDGSGLGVVGGTLVGYIVVSFFNYLWHRSTHAVPLLWRGFHQLHHSPQRVDMSGSLLFHPLDLGVYIALTTLVTTLVLGLDPLAAALTAYVAQFYSFFQHLNVRTPTWLGYFIQRPEAHCVHHAREVHFYNFGDLPLWDMLFGTFRNPTSWQGEAGFEAVASRRWGAMLAFVDVNQPVLGDASLGRSEPVKAAT